MAEYFGKCLGYDGKCPNCGRVRLERYENGKRVCEKCGWCPENHEYVDPYEYLKEQEHNAFVASQTLESEKERRRSELMNWSKGSLVDHIMSLEQNTDKQPVTLEQQVKNKIRNTTVAEKPKKPGKLYDAPGELTKEADAYIKMVFETAHDALYGMLYDSQLFTVRRVVENGRWVNCEHHPGKGTLAVIKALYDELGLMRDDYEIFSLPEENDKKLHITIDFGIHKVDLQIKPLEGE